MADPIDIAEYMPHMVAEVMCVRCLHRWWAVWMQGTALKDLECPNCGPGFVILTGQFADADGRE